MIMNYYRAIDRSVIQFDFLTHRKEEGQYDKEIESLGGRIFHAPRLFPQNYPSYVKYMRSLFKKTSYQIVHSHIDAMSTFPLYMAKKSGIPIRIAHSHSDSVDVDFKFPIKKIAKCLLPSVATNYWACSDAAGSYLFGKSNIDRCTVIKNAIDCELFKENETIRKKKRSELNLDDDDIVIGHIGRFEPVKNQKFLLELAERAVVRGLKFKVILVGDGKLRSRISSTVQKKGLDDVVYLLGIRKDIPDLMQAFDVLVFPSFHEGIPVTLIEAQASGLPVVISDRVSSETLILPNTLSLSLNEPYDEWIDAIMSIATSGRYPSPYSILERSGYDIKSNSILLMNQYLCLKAQI